MAIKKLPGTDWHITTLHKDEKDDRRHRTRCEHYNKQEKCCNYGYSKCIGSAHCPEYREFPVAAGSSNTFDKQYITSSNTIWKIGDKVVHSRYGNGCIIAIDEKQIEVSFLKSAPNRISKRKRMEIVVRFDIEVIKNGTLRRG